ncbi:MAG: hypothetical protein M3O02_06550 [Acidobacteriota bacterium]|nr:hypothetical protein [Acidobacteriota bacterium]
MHGYATQALLFSTGNNWNTTPSRDGSTGWTEAVVNLSAVPAPKLRIGVQARYFLLGDYGNAITLDWAQADYKFNERIGIRAGKVKSPVGMLNEIQDVDPAYLWILLPQSVYPLASRTTLLSHFGGVVYGSVPLGESFGKIKYRLWGGERRVPSQDGSFEPLRDNGLSFPNGLTSRVGGLTFRWVTPIPGLTAGANASRENPRGAVQVTQVGLQGEFSAKHLHPYTLFVSYERKRAFVGGEYNRTTSNPTIAFTGFPARPGKVDQRSFYVMASYKLTEKLTGGVYYSSSINTGIPVSSARFQKDWTISARYDATPFLYLKAEEHVLDGTEIGFSTSNNARGLQADSRLALLKLGVTF